MLQSGTKRFSTCVIPAQEVNDQRSRPVSSRYSYSRGDVIYQKRANVGHIRWPDDLFLLLSLTSSRGISRADIVEREHCLRGQTPRWSTSLLGKLIYAALAAVVARTQRRRRQRRGCRALAYGDTVVEAEGYIYVSSLDTESVKRSVYVSSQHLYPGKKEKNSCNGITRKLGNVWLQRESGCSIGTNHRSYRDSRHRLAPPTLLNLAYSPYTIRLAQHFFETSRFCCRCQRRFTGDS